jgi:hydrogenase maturation protease
MWATLDTAKPVLVVGVGNLIQTDDGIGIHTIRALAERPLPEEVDLLDGGTMGIELLPWLERRDAIIFIDAVDGGMAPGTIFRFEPQQLHYEVTPKMSVHQIGLIDALAMSTLNGVAPRRIVIFGVQPAVVDWGEELTDALKPAVDKVVRRVLAEIESSVQELVPLTLGGIHE